MGRNSGLSVSQNASIFAGTVRRSLVAGWWLAVCLSFVCAVLSCVLWVRGRSHNETYWWQVYRYRENLVLKTALGVESGAGGLRFYYRTRPDSYERARRLANQYGSRGFARHRGVGTPAQYPSGHLMARPDASFWRRHGVILNRGYAPDLVIRYAQNYIWSLTVPAWLAVACFLIVPVSSVPRLVRTLKRRHRRRRGQCQDCGYDLRASLVRCPECGAGIARGTETSAQTVTAVPPTP